MSVYSSRRTWYTSRGALSARAKPPSRATTTNALDVRYIGYSLRVSNRGATMWAQAKDKHGVSYAWPLFFVP